MTFPAGAVITTSAPPYFTQNVNPFSNHVWAIFGPRFRAILGGVFGAIFGAFLREAFVF